MKRREEGYKEYCPAGTDRERRKRRVEAYKVMVEGRVELQGRTKKKKRW